MTATTPEPPLTANDLPIRVPLIDGETTASYLARTAHANGVPLPVLGEALAEDGLDIPEDGLLPQREELLLPAEGLGRLAVLVGREPDELAAALPTVASGEELRLDHWPADVGAGRKPLPACPLCMEPGAWLVAGGERWRPCSCGRRWMAGDDGGYLVDTGPVPDLGRALHRHRAMVEELGPAGEALLADAHQVALWWWISGQVAAEEWHAREDALGMGRQRRRAAPTVVYPEAVTLAELMRRWEERRRRPNASAEKWVAAVGRLSPAGALSKRERAPLRYWLEQHRTEPASRATGRTAAERRWNRLPTLHHRDERGPFGAPSCLMWVYGLPLTETAEVCPRCNGRAPSCRWVPYPGCTGRPKK